MQRGILSTPEYWRDSFHQLQYLGALLIRFSQITMALTEVWSFRDARAAITHLGQRGIVDPNFWLNNFHKVRYLDTLFIRVANRVR